jgi:CheY-like chemotaxis protein
MSNNIKILWADDEIDVLKPHIIFLNNKGYDVVTVTNGLDAIDETKKQHFDVIFLDENMPGISGLETLGRIKADLPLVPIVMITKSEEEHIMEDAIGSKIADYLIKPVNPNQILLSVKKLIDNKRLVSEKTTMGYQQEFRSISMAFMDDMNFEEWKNIYRKLVYWELELSQTGGDGGMHEVLDTQKTDANHNFSKYIKDNYIKILKSDEDSRPIMSNTLLRKKVFPLLEKPEPVFFLLIDNLRYDQWKTIQPIISEIFRVDDEDLYMSILPTTTQYARNSIFSGLLPSEMEKRFPNMWSNDEDEGGKNLHELEFLNDYIQRLRKNVKTSYVKVTNLDAGKELAENVMNLMDNQLNVIVYNFVDALSHARTDVSLMRELSEDEAAYRSVTKSWFEHSPLLEALKKIAEKPCKLIITTDHGSIRVKDPVKIIGDRNTNTNLRYKQGKNLNYDLKEVFEVRKPEDAFLPKLHVSSTFAFADNYSFFAYPNNYNYYVNYYKGTFQHGGISLEEMMCPIITLSSKR